MLSDEDIQSLITLPKRITNKTPANGYRDQGSHARCDLELEATTPDDARFAIFIRRHNRFIENFSIGLRYRTSDRTLGSITLVRYNGPHGETSRDPDGHYDKPHVHINVENLDKDRWCSILTPMRSQEPTKWLAAQQFRGWMGNEGGSIYNSQN